MMNDIAYGLHNAPPSMLVCREEEKVVVVDGNKRLLAIRLMTEPEFAQRMSDRLPDQGHTENQRRARSAHTQRAG